MLDKQTIHPPEGLKQTINDAYRADERSTVSSLIQHARLDTSALVAVEKQATHLVERARADRKKSTGIDSFLSEYALSSEEGIALMCLAEALLRVPDNETVDNLIKDKLAKGDWKSHKGQSSSFFVNAATWALMLTGKVLSPEKAENALSKSLMTLINRSGEPVVRRAVDKAMRIMSKQFVMGRTINEALKRAKEKEKIGYRYSYDMLGEAALTEVDAKRYMKSYTDAIHSIGKMTNGSGTVYSNPGISIKLSALHPRYQTSQYERVLQELLPRLLALAQLAKSYNIALTVDAEESERLDLSLDVMEKVLQDESLNDWDGFGMALQSYQKRAFYVLDWIQDIARKTKRRMMVRLIKGAYWDSEIKKAQMQGLKDYPVFTKKIFTDTSFQACAKKILTMTDVIYPQFATHNAYSVALILELVGSYRDFEFQCLHGMGNELYSQIVPKDKMGIPCRIYAPVGIHEDLLPYLVRRLLENGANSSFVNRIVDDNAPVSQLVQDPIAKAES
jgi:RHH-type proline utilization regulon transcriptional repressor/proline dehydrogenase/delta 1-pyrroline-5-carboxylate dehydrogenase